MNANYGLFPPLAAARCAAARRSSRWRSAASTTSAAGATVSCRAASGAAVGRLMPPGGAHLAAAIDVGSNSVLLLTVAVRPTGAPARSTRPSRRRGSARGCVRGGTLDPAAVRRTRDAVVAFAARARARGVRRRVGVRDRRRAPRGRRRGVRGARSRPRRACRSRSSRARARRRSRMPRSCTASGSTTRRCSRSTSAVRPPS